MYKRVYDRLKSFCNKQDAIKMDGHRVETMYSEELVNLNTTLEEKIKVNKEYRHAPA